MELWHRSSSNIWNPNRLKCFSNDLPFEPERIIFCMKIERIFIIRLKVANNGMCVGTSGSVHTCQRLVLWVTNQPPHANSNLINLIQLYPLYPPARSPGDNLTRASLNRGWLNLRWISMFEVESRNIKSGWTLLADNSYKVVDCR